jgi:hypothetical protein
MNRRQLFLSPAKAALASVLGGSFSPHQGGPRRARCPCCAWLPRMAHWAGMAQRLPNLQGEVAMVDASWAGTRKGAG